MPKGNVCGRLSSVEAKKPTVYIETTVPNYVFNENYANEQEVAKLVFEAIDKDIIKGFVSVVVEDELEKAPEELCPKLTTLLKNCERLKVTGEVIKLVERYIKEKAFPASKPADATHVAVASFYGIDYVFSWNFRHIVRESTIRKVTAVNELLGYQTPKIVNPEEVIFDVLEQKS